MGWGVQRTRKRLPGAFALLGVAFYALLLPWHLTSQLGHQLFAADFGVAAEFICSSGGQAGSSSSIPAAPTTSCPFCKGLAAFQLALLPTPCVVAPPPFAASLERLALHADVADAAGIPTRSRGPPSPA